MTTDLVAHMRLPAYKLLWQSLYGSPHGFGERKLKLHLTSAQRGITLAMPLTCHYEDNVPILSTRGVSKSDWAALCKLVADETVLKVIIFDAEHDILARITECTARSPKVDLYSIKFRWQDDDEVARVLKKGFRWFASILD